MSLPTVAFSLIFAYGESAGFCVDGLTCAAEFASPAVDTLRRLSQTFGELPGGRTVCVLARARFFRYRCAGSKRHRQIIWVDLCFNSRWLVNVDYRSLADQQKRLILFRWAAICLATAVAIGGYALITLSDSAAMRSGTLSWTARLVTAKVKTT